MGKLLAYFLVFVIVCTIVGTCAGFIGNTGKTITEQYSPSVLLKKYESFKDISAAIDKKRADIEVYKETIADLRTNSDNSKEDKFNIQQNSAELMGLISMHNQLCADYNAQMSKFNYRFTNAGDLPASNLTPLPREIKPYILSTK